MRTAPPGTPDFAIFGGGAAQEFRTARAACVLRDVLRGSRTPRARPTCGSSVEIAEGREVENLSVGFRPFQSAGTGSL